MQEKKIITIKRNGHTIEYTPIVKPCTYHFANKEEKCRNCNNTRTYVAGYTMVVDGKMGFFVDNIK